MEAPAEDKQKDNDAAQEDLEKAMKADLEDADGDKNDAAEAPNDNSNA